MKIKAGITEFMIKTGEMAMKKIAGKKNSLTLRQYMEAHPNGVGIETAVAMLLGVALQLRDMHNNGTAHLQISPDSVLVSSSGAALRPATDSETDRYTSGYAAPEIYRGTSAGNRSDIYSFCAVLSFAATGVHPDNALARAEAETEESVHPDTAVAQLIRTGMEPDAENRYASMQELILKLSAYNVRPFAAQPEKKIAEKRKTSLPQISGSKIALPKIAVPKVRLPQSLLVQISKLKLWLRNLNIQPKKLAFIAVAVLPTVLACIYAGCYNGAKNRAKTGDFAAAEKLLVVPAITKKHDPQLLVYLDGLRQLDEGSYAEANGTFETVSGYLDADTFAQEASFRLAQEYAQKEEFDIAFEIMGQLYADGYDGADEELNRLYYEFALYSAQKNDFDTALEVMTRLQETGYADASYKVAEFHYSRGNYLLQEEKDYAGAYEAFSTAAELEYTGAEEMKKETVYREAIALIAEKEYVKAYRKLKEIPGYRDVDSSQKALEENMYQLAQRHYRSGDYEQAEYYFTALAAYEDSLRYRQLINARNIQSGSFYASSFMLRKTIEDLAGMFYFEDTAQVLLSNKVVAEEFLRGTWKGGGYYFTMDKEGDISYNLPWFSYGDYFTISNGEVLLYPENNEKNTRPLFYIEATSPTSISVYCYKDCSSHMLYLQ